MRILTEKINLDLNQNGIQATIDLREGDIESRLIIATLRGYGDAFRPDDDVIAVIRAKKPDGTIIYNNCLVEDGKIKFLVTSQYAAVVGNYNACIELIKDGVVLYSPKFSFHVAANELSDSEVESASEYTELTTALEQALTALELAQNLHLVKFVEDLEDEGDEKYLYVLTSDYHYLPYVWDAENERYMQLESNLEELAEFAYLLDIQRERVDNLLAEAAPGSTTRDLEVIDGRTGYDGRTYANLGTAIREQVNDLHSEATNLQNSMEAADTNLNNIKANKSDVNTTTANIEAEIAVERARIDNIAHLAEGSTTGDAELADIRVGADGITYNNAGDAVRAQENLLNKVINDTIETIIGKNIAPPNLSEGYLKPDGSLTEYLDWATTDFIKVEGLENVIYSAYNSSDEQQYATTMFFLTLYDSGRNVIEQVSSPSYIYEVDSDVCFIRFSLHTDVIDHFMVESGTEYSTYEPYYKIYKAVNNDYAMASDLENVEIDLRKIETCFDDIYVFYDANFTLSPSAISNNGVLINTLPDTKTTDYIDCSEWFGIRYTGASWLVCRALAFYDSSKNWIISYPETGDTTYYTNEIIPIPKNAKYVVFGDLTKKVAQTLQIEINIGKKTNGKWKGKKWTCVGDSLTEYNLRTNLHYFDYVAQATEISVVNMGKSGTGYKNTYDEGFAFYQRIVNVPLDSDVITIFGSFNDLGKGYTLGTETDTGTETIAGCINTTLDNLFERLPLANVGIVSPTPWVGYFPLDTHIGAQYSALLEKICKRRGIPFLNLYYCSALRPWEEGFRELCYSKDEGNGVHPDETGHKIIAPRFEAFLETLLM